MTADNHVDRLVKLPEGLIRYGEAPEGALKRIILGYTGFEVEPLALLGIYTKFGTISKDNSESGHSITIVFVCLILDLRNEVNTLENTHDCIWLDNRARQAEISINEDDKKILRDYRTWREDKSTFWTSKQF